MADYQEMPGSPTETWSTEGLSAQRILKCVWEDRYAVRNQLYIENDGFYPYTTGGAYIRTVGIVGSPSDRVLEVTPDDPTIAKYTNAILTVGYEPITGESRDPEDPNNPEGITLIEEAIEPVTEFLTLDNGRYFWQANAGFKNQPLNEHEAPATIINFLTWRITLHFMKNIPDEVLTLPGKVNDSQVYSTTLDKTFDVETLLFSPPNLTRSWITNQEPRWTMVLSYPYREKTWNKFFCADAEKLGYAAGENFIPITDAAGDGGGTTPIKIYPLGDFTKLLPPPPSP